MKYLVQGFFFQQNPFTGREDQGMFAGLFGVLPGREYLGLQGGMGDAYGEANLTDITVGEDHFSFTKKYPHRHDTIRYEFTKSADGFWYGDFNGNATGHGKSRCVLTAVPDDFFSPVR